MLSEYIMSFRSELLKSCVFGYAYLLDCVLSLALEAPDSLWLENVDYDVVIRHCANSIYFEYLELSRP